MSDYQESKLEQFSYPRTYTTSKGWKIFLYLIGILIVIGSLYISGYLWIKEDTTSIFIPIIGVGLAILGLYIIIDTYKSKIILNLDSIEIIGALPARRLYRGEISGYKTIETNNVDVIVLVPTNPLKKKIKINLIIKMDKAITIWLYSLPNLDEQEAKNIKNDIIQENFPSKTKEEVKQKLEKISKLVLNINIFAGVSCAIAYFFPNIYTISLIALFPWLALIITGKNNGLIILDDNKNNPLPSLGLTLFFPSLIIGVISISEVKILDLQLLFIWASSLAMFMTFIVTRVDTNILKRNKIVIIIISVILFTYSAGTIAIYDKKLDRSEPTIFNTTVINSYITSGKSPNNVLEITPWGNKKEDSQENVSRELIEKTNKNDIICVNLFSGRFNIKWYELNLCN